MRLLSRSLVHTPARFLQDEYSISYSTILRIDKEVLENDIPKPEMEDVQGVLIDEKHVGASQGFVTVCLNASAGEPLEMVRDKDSHCLDDFFNKFNDEEKRKIKYLGIDRSNAYRAAAIQHLPHIKVCYDAYHLVSNMNQVLDKIRRFTMKHPSYTLAIHERKALCAAQRQGEHQSGCKSNVEKAEHPESRPLHRVPAQGAIPAGISDKR